MYAQMRATLVQNKNKFWLFWYSVFNLRYPSTAVWLRVVSRSSVGGCASKQTRIFTSSTLPNFSYTSFITAFNINIKSPCYCSSTVKYSSRVDEMEAVSRTHLNEEKKSKIFNFSIQIMGLFVFKGASLIRKLTAVSFVARSCRADRMCLQSRARSMESHEPLTQRQRRAENKEQRRSDTNTFNPASLLFLI